MTKALVPVAPEHRPPPPAGPRQHAKADFIAHLIATAAQAPQTRIRRRADPEHALAAYRALGQRPTETGRALSQSL